MVSTTTGLELKDPELLRNQNYIGGQWVADDNGKTLDVRNPSTGELVGSVPAMGAAETRRAIEAGQDGQGAGGADPSPRRADARTPG